MEFYLSSSSERLPDARILFFRIPAGNWSCRSVSFCDFYTSEYKSKLSKGNTAYKFITVAVKKYNRSDYCFE